MATLLAIDTDGVLYGGDKERGVERGRLLLHLLAHRQEAFSIEKALALIEPALERAGFRDMEGLKALVKEGRPESWQAFGALMARLGEGEKGELYRRAAQHALLEGMPIEEIEETVENLTLLQPVLDAIGRIVLDPDVVPILWSDSPVAGATFLLRRMEDKLVEKVAFARRHSIAVGHNIRHVHRVGYIYNLHFSKPEEVERWLKSREKGDKLSYHYSPPAVERSKVEALAELVKEREDIESVYIFEDERDNIAKAKAALQGVGREIRVFGLLWRDSEGKIEDM